MASQKTQNIVHTIRGGWATDYGSTYMGSPQGEQVAIPWLSQAENLLYTLDGGVKKWPGTTLNLTYPIVDPTEGSSVVRGIYDYWRQTSSQKIVLAVGSSYYDHSGFSATRIGGYASGFSVSDKIANFSTFNDLLIIANTGNLNVYSWDQTTFQSLAGTPPNFSFSTPHKGRHWASGVTSAPSRLYYSAVGNPEDWVGAGSGSIDIDPGDGDQIVGLLSWKDDLWVFKGPNRLSIHRITGSSPSDFARIPFITGVSAANQNVIFKYGNDIGFWSPRGSCHSLSATANYGDYAEAFINFPILSWCRNSRYMNAGASEYWQAVTDPFNNYTILIFTGRGALSNPRRNNNAIVMDWKFADDERYPRFSRLTYAAFNSIAMVKNSSQSVPFWGTDDGKIFSTKVEQDYHRGGEYSHDIPLNGAIIPFRFQTPYLSYGPDLQLKSVNDFNITLSTKHRSTITVNWGGTKQPKQTTTITQPGYTPIGTFVLDTDCLGDLGNQPAFSQELHGEYRSIQYTVVEDSALTGISGTGAGIQFSAFGVTLTPSGTSMETPA